MLNREDVERIVENVLSSLEVEVVTKINPNRFGMSLDQGKSLLLKYRGKVISETSLD